MQMIEKSCMSRSQVQQAENSHAGSRSKRGGNSLKHRLSVVEATLRVQAATGASHLQQIEASPQAFGVASSARPAIRRLRRQRNQAFHGNRVSDWVAEIETRIDNITANGHGVDQAGNPKFQEEFAAFTRAHLSVGKGKGAFPQCGSCRSRPAVSSPAFCRRCGHPFNVTLRTSDPEQMDDLQG